LQIFTSATCMSMNGCWSSGSQCPICKKGQFARAQPGAAPLKTYMYSIQGAKSILNMFGS
jgi:hypothetical protein